MTYKDKINAIINGIDIRGNNNSIKRNNVVGSKIGIYINGNKNKVLNNIIKSKQ